MGVRRPVPCGLEFTLAATCPAALWHTRSERSAATVGINYFLSGHGMVFMPMCQFASSMQHSMQTRPWKDPFGDQMVSHHDPCSVSPCADYVCLHRFGAW